MTDYGKMVKCRLIQKEMTQKQLLAMVRERTGMYIDDSYLLRILDGKHKPVKIIEAINEILDIEQTGTKTAEA